MKQNFIYISLGVILLIGCNNKYLSSELSLDKPIPDEYLVVPNAPLVVPPEFHLRSPKQNVSYSNEKVKLDYLNADKNLTPSAQDLLNKADANKDFNNIRELIDTEHKKKIEKKKDVNFLNKILPKYKAKKENLNEQLNPIEEHKRLKAIKTDNIEDTENIENIEN